MSNSILPIIMAIAELVGAAIYVSTKDTAKRAALTCFGLGFALCIVLADIVPDATENNPMGWVYLAVGVAVGAGLMFKAGEGGTAFGNAASIAGMGLHNLCEGVVLAAGGPAFSPLIFAGAVAHKLPEGMVVFSLMERMPFALRWATAALLSLLIPLGTQILLPESIEKVILPLAIGVLFVVLSKSLLLFARRERKEDVNRRAVVVSTAVGAVLAGLSCMVI